MSTDGRKPCEHGRYESHWSAALPAANPFCPGGSPIEGEKVWWCDYPEFGDLGCLRDHDIKATRQPRKHTDCGWRLLISIE